MEAVYAIEVEDFPAFVPVDDKGNDFYQKLSAIAPVKQLPQRPAAAAPAASGVPQAPAGRTSSRPAR
jgi:hypothetical protein